MALSKIDVANMLTGTIPVDNSKSGSILQVQSTLLTTSFEVTCTGTSTTNGSITDITGLSVNITPSSTSSKIMILCRIFYEPNNHNADAFFGLRDGSNNLINTNTESGNWNKALTKGFVGYHLDDNNSTPDSANFFTIHSPNTTSQFTYKAYCGTGSSNKTYKFNRSHGDDDAHNYERGSSEIIAMEIKG